MALIPSSHKVGHDNRPSQANLFLIISDEAIKPILLICCYLGQIWCPSGLDAPNPLGFIPVCVRKLRYKQSGGFVHRGIWEVWKKFSACAFGSADRSRFLFLVT